MTDEPEQFPDREQAAGVAAARAARRARRIGGRSTPTGPSTGDVSAEDTTEHSGARDASASAGAAPAADESERDRQTAAVQLDKPVGPATAPAPAEPAEDRPTRSPARSWLPALVLAVVCLGFLGWGAYESHGVWWARSSSSVADERGPVLAAAKSCMAAMNTYDYRKLAQSEAHGVACTTGAFTGQYKQAFDKLIKPQAAKVQFTQTAQINNAGIESVSGDGQQWVALVFGQLTTTNSRTGTSAPTLTPFSARVTMQHVGGKWLVANYQYAPTS